MPSFECLIVGQNTLTGVPEFGAGSHLSRDVALCRALTEAVQARTTYIAGSRDDITAEHYSDEAKAERHRQAREIIENARPTRPYHDIPDLAGGNFSSDLRVTLDKLEAVGLNQVLRVDLSKRELAIPVVRVVVPGLEGAFESPDSDYLPGARAMAVLDEGMGA